LKYLPLVWAAIARKPVRALMTLLSVTVAFTLFGLMIGFNATIDQVEARAHADRVFSGPRFDFIGGVPMAVARQIARMPGVKQITVSSFLPGYVGDPKNRTFVVLADAAMPSVFPDWGISPKQWAAVTAEPTALVMSRMQAELWHKKVGDSFTVISNEIARADGGKSWTFKIVAIVPDMPQAGSGFNFGNYAYFDASVPKDKRGRIGEVDLVTADPTHASQLAEHIDALYANSATPTQSQTERAAYAVGNNFGGLDVHAVTHQIALAGLAMILFLSANVIAQSVRERFAEFAALRTLGFSTPLLVGLVVAEAALPSLVGAGAGVGLAALLSGQLPALLPRGIGLPLPTMAASVYGWAVLSALAMAFASAALPALRLTRMDIAAALAGRG
jgi:putative ABC transport system permease protein